MAAEPLPDEPFPPALLIDDEPIDAAELGAWLDQAGDALELPPAPAEGDGTVDIVPPAVRRFSETGIVNDEVADWAMAKVAEAEATVASAKALRDQRIEKIKAWYDTEAKRLDREVAFFGMHLKAYLRGLRLTSKGKVKSKKLVAGSITSRTANPGGKVTLAEPDAVLAWLQASYGAEWLQGLIDAAADEATAAVAAVLEWDADDERGDVLAAIAAAVQPLFEAAVLEQPYGDAVKLTETPMVSGIKELVQVADGRAIDVTTGEPVPGLGVEPETVEITVKPA